MDERVGELAGLLRANGARPGVAEVADAVRAAALVGVGDRETLRAALRSTLVKRASDGPIFDGAFELWSSMLGRALLGLERGLLAELEAAGLASADRTEVARALAALQSPLARATLGGDAAALARLLGGAAARIAFADGASPALVAFQGRRLLALAGAAEARDDTRALEAALAARGLDPGALRLVSERVEALLRRAEEAARALVDGHARARGLARGRATPDAPATAEEVQRTEAAVRRLAGRLRDRLVRRDRTRRKGALAVCRTLRRNLGLGGVPARLLFRTRRPERPDVLVLCDVSESVRATTRLMLGFLYALQACFRRVRTFVFVNELAEVTAALRAEPDPRRAAEAAVRAPGVSLAGNSNYGRALRDLHRGYLGAVTRRSTVIVIGDGRSNHAAPEAWVLAELRRRARRVLWICTEPRWSWGTGDSEMPRYAAACDRVAVAGSLDDLERLADELVPRR
jgi:hypothetical protein